MSLRGISFVTVIFLELIKKETTEVLIYTNSNSQKGKFTYIHDRKTDNMMKRALLKL